MIKWRLQQETWVLLIVTAIIVSCCGAAYEQSQLVHVGNFSCRGPRIQNFKLVSVLEILEEVFPNYIILNKTFSAEYQYVRSYQDPLKEECNTFQLHHECLIVYIRLSTKRINVCCTFCFLASLQWTHRLDYISVSFAPLWPNHWTDAWRLDSKIPWFPKFVFFIFTSAATAIERQSWSQLFQARRMQIVRACELNIWELELDWNIQTSGN